MSRNQRYRGLQKFIEDKYDSDTDLPEEDQKKIKHASDYEGETTADEYRQKAWDKAGLYPKIKRIVGDAWSGDIHKKKKK